MVGRWNSGMMEYTQKKNINRGYMKLEVWCDAIELFRMIHQILSKMERLDLKLKSQIYDLAQSVSGNIAEGYCRRTINEYLYFLNVALGSLGELMTRMIGLKIIEKLPEEDFNLFDELHYQVENKLLALIKSLQIKQKDGTWEMELKEPVIPYSPT